MLTKKQVIEIKNHLERAQNPLFFFDNDTDGLCSFFLLQRFLGRGKGVPIKSFPALDESYFRKIEELNADYVFILDKPVVSAEFFDRINEVNLPVVWIDHHNIDLERIPKFVNVRNAPKNRISEYPKVQEDTKGLLSYYNPFFNRKKSNEPVTALCYQITNNKSDIWLAVAGCISDRFFPKFYPQFKKKFPELAINSKDAFEILYKSEIGRLARILNHGLKDRTTNVISMLKFMIKVKTPYEVLEETTKNHLMHLRFKQIDSSYQKFLSKAKKIGSQPGKILFFEFGGDLSFSGDLSNELSFEFPEKIIVVIYIKGMYANISMRGKNVRKVILNAIDGLNDATGGGHEDAVGAKIKTNDLKEFKKRIEKIVT